MKSHRKVLIILAQTDDELNTEYLCTTKNILINIIVPKIIVFILKIQILGVIKEI